MKPLFPKIINSNHKSSKSYRSKKLKINLNNLSNPYNTNSQIKLLKNKKEKQQCLSPKEINTYLRTFSNNNFSKKDSNFIDSIQDFAKNSKIKTIEEYDKNTDDLMVKYTYSNPDDEVTNYEAEMTRTKADYYSKTKDDVKSILNKSRRLLMKSMLDIRKQKALIKLKETDFKNPIDSLGLILKNKTIHDKVINSYQNREMQSFGRTIGEYNRIKELINMSKNVKITSMMSKAFEMEFQVQTDLDNKISEKDNINENYLNAINNDSIENKIESQIKKKNYFKAKGLSSYDFLKGNVFLLTGYNQDTKICPESREQFSFNYDPITNCIYLFSGNSCYIGKHQLWRYNLLTFNWEALNAPSQLMEGRSGHTGIIYKSKLIIFGGRYLNNTTLADVDIYNIDNNSWAVTQLNTSIFLQLRRNHVACLVGQQMFIHGGVDELGEYLDDSYLLNLSGSYRWIKAMTIAYGPSPKLGYHSCCLVCPMDIQKNPKFSVYRFPEITITSINRINTQIREKGIYLFGGKKSDLKDPCNKLWLLKIGRKPLEWTEVKAKGKPPCPRYLCSMNYYEKGNFIIIHGGKTKSLRNENILKDTYLFELFRFEWIRVKYGCFESLVKPRFSHAAVIYKEKLIIFGGVNEQGFNGSNFFLIKLETEENPHQFLKKKNNSGMKKNLLTLKSLKDKNGNDEKDDKGSNKKTKIGLFSEKKEKNK